MPERFPCQVKPGFWVAAALLVYLDEGGRLLLPFAGACVCHELGHLLAARLLGLEVYALTLSAMGAELHISRRCSYLREGALLGAGVAVNLLLCLLCARLPWEGSHLFAAVNLLLACFNLLPVPPLDGGELTRLVITALCPGRAGWLLCRAVSALCCACMVYAGVLFALRGNPSLLCLALWLGWGISGELLDSEG